MVTGGVNKCVKYLLFLFNLAFVGVGIALIAIGVSTQAGFVKYLHLFDTNAFTAPPKLCIAIGVIMFLIAFLGCCGAWMENHSMIMAYSVLVGLILIMQLGVGIAALLLESDVENLAEKGLLSSMDQYHNSTLPDNLDIRSSWDIVQTEFKCCGVNNFTDWTRVVAKHAMNETLIPSSCCIGGAHDNCSATINENNFDDPSTEVDLLIYTEGCLHKAVHDLAIDRIGTVAIVFAVVELLGVMCACILARSIRFSYETV